MDRKKQKCDIDMALGALLQAKAMKSFRTLEWYRRNVGAFRSWLLENCQPTALGDITAEMAHAFMAAERSRNKVAARQRLNPASGRREGYQVELDGRLSEHSLNSAIRNLQAFGRWLVKNHWVEASPFETLEKADAPKLRKKVLSEDEINYLLSKLNDQMDTGARNMAILWLLLDTGIRVSELASLGMDKINLSERDDGPWIQVIGKDREERRIGLSASTRNSVAHYVGNFRPDWVPYDRLRVRELEARGHAVVNNPLFLTVQVHGLDHPGGHQLLRNAVQLIVSRLAKRVGIAGLTPHACRRTFATQNLELGASPLDIMHELGHSSLTMTLHYASLADQSRMKRHRQFSYMERVSKTGKQRIPRKVEAERSTSELPPSGRRAKTGR